MTSVVARVFYAVFIPVYIIMWWEDGIQFIVIRIMY